MQARLSPGEAPLSYHVSLALQCVFGSSSGSQLGMVRVPQGALCLRDAGTQPLCPAGQAQPPGREHRSSGSRCNWLQGHSAPRDTRAKAAARGPSFRGETLQMPTRSPVSFRTPRMLEPAAGLRDPHNFIFFWKIPSFIFHLFKSACAPQTPPFMRLL